MRPPALLVGFSLLAAAAACSAPIPDRPPDRVTVMFDEMRSRKYAQTGFDFPKLEWSDIPALLARADSTKELKTFPTNPISSLHIPNRLEGMVALWLVEGVRKGGKYPSLNPRFLPEGYTTKERGEHQQAVAKAYRAWWAEVKALPPAEARAGDPLAGTGYAWR
jgi:hypothetical protein